MDPIRQALERARSARLSSKDASLDPFTPEASAGAEIVYREVKLSAAHLEAKRIVAHDPMLESGRYYDMLRTQVLQAMAAEAGFDLKIRVTEFATSLKQAEAGEYQAFMLEWSGRSDPDGNAFNHLHSGAALNYSAWSNAAADKALEDARLVSDMAKRKAIYETLVREQQADEPILYLYHRKFLFAQTTRLEGFKPMPDGLLRVVGLKLK